MLGLILCPNQPFPDAKSWVCIHLCDDFLHIISLWYAFLTMAHRFIVSSMWVCRDLLSLPDVMAVTSSVDNVSSNHHHHLETQTQCDKTLVFHQDISTILLLLHVSPCSDQLAIIHHLDQVICLHWHRPALSDCHHLCHSHSSISILKSLLEAQSPTSELLSPRQSKWLEGCWLQLICCTLPKHLCP